MKHQLPDINTAQLALAGEIIIRTSFMFLLIILLLRLTGRRGVRQLTLFEVAMILALGSAAGDPMFQKEIPLVHSIIVFAIVLFWYKIITLLVARSKLMTKLLEGREMVIVKNGMFNIEENKRNNFSQNEFFAELRNHSIEHLGQIKIALLEIDGKVSIIRYPKEEVKYGLPLFPRDECESTKAQPRACTFCGYVETVKINKNCKRCYKNKWIEAINT